MPSQSTVSNWLMWLVKSIKAIPVSQSSQRHAFRTIEAAIRQCHGQLAATPLTAPMTLIFNQCRYHGGLCYIRDSQPRQFSLGELCPSKIHFYHLKRRLRMTKPYLTIKETGNYTRIIKKSRFITHLARIQSEDEAKTIIDQISHENAKANHNVYAYVLGNESQIQRASDNGEPSGTAGSPTLEGLLNHDIRDVVAVTTRYFGGIKLGAGGLIRAYAGNVNNAIETIGIVARIKQKTVTFQIPYADLEPLQHFLTTHHLTIAKIDYGVKVTMTLYLDEDQLEASLALINDFLNGQFSPTIGQSEYREAPYPFAQNRE
jgi:uncharacterized YigZ family protein